MAEYINRETLLKAVEKMDRLDKETNTKYEYDKEGYILLIKSAPTADVEKVKHGKWVDVIEEVNNTCAGITFKGFAGYKCSLCGRQEIRKESYCHCGAKMDGGNAE